jgi:PIN like domain
MDNTETAEQALLKVLDRGTPLNALSALEYSLNTSPPADSGLSLNETAIALDTNVLLKLASHHKSAEVADYLSGKHQAPLVLPGQVIQEFWNNHVGSLKTVADLIHKRLDELTKTIEELDPQGRIAGDLAAIKDKVEEDYSFLYDKALGGKTRTMLSSLAKRAIVPFAKRPVFSSTAELRKRTKTPPGFRDDGHGDFFVWVDLLTGLQQASAGGITFRRVAVITNDEKPDWVRNGMAHPILSSEVRSLFNVPLEIWNLDRLVKEVGRAPTVTAADHLTESPAQTAEGSSL